MESDRTTTIQELKDLRQKFIMERGWQARRTPRNTATSIIVEAAELLEHFQWGEEANKDEVAKELADVLAYCLDLATALDIDIATAYREKTAHARQKYPTKLFNPENSSRADYHRIKKEYRAEKKKP